jgi:YesN/AraC family two-component response regulator
MGPATAYNVNLTHQESPSSSVTYSETYKYCGTLYPNQTCSWIFNVTVPEKTTPSLIKTYTVGSWKNPDLTLNEISEKISIPTHYLSQIINTSLNQNFYDFINSFRIEESKILFSKIFLRF